MVSAAICLTALIGCLTVSAERGEGTITVGTAEAKAGDSVTVPVELKYTSSQEGGLGIAAALFDIKFDTNVLTITKIEREDPENDAIAYTVEWRTTDGNPSSIDVRDGAVRILAVGKDETAVVPSMSLNLTFTINSEASAGASNVTVEMIQACDFGTADFEGVYANDEDMITMSAINGSVTVAEDQTEPVKDENLKIRSAALVLENGFSLNFNVRKTVIDGVYTDPYIVFKKAIYESNGNISSYEEKTVSFSDVSDSTENYVYTLSGIMPQEIGSDIIATIFATKDGVLCEGTTVEYSVLTFATNQLKSATTGISTKKALADMLYYGEEVQKYSNYNTANLVTDKATEILGDDTWKENATGELSRELVSAQTNTALEGATVKIRSASLTLDDKVIVNFTCSELDNSVIKNTEDYVLKITYDNNYSIPQSYEVSINSETGVAAFDKLFSTEMSTKITATIIDVESQSPVSNTVTYSIETFVKNRIDDPTYGAICRALVKYGDSVKAYAGIE